MKSESKNRPVALVTGGCRGIGLAITKNLAISHDVWVGGRNHDELSKVCDEIPRTTPFCVDLTDVKALTTACQQIQQLDVLVHSAGVFTRGTISELSDADWHEIFSINVIAVANLTRELLPKLRATTGLVLMINSGAGLTSGPGSAAYCASKFALRALTDALREEERGRVRVAAIHPGRVATDMQAEIWDAAGKPYRPADHLSPASIADAVRLAVDLPKTANIDLLSIRPSQQINP